ncbi:carboxylating nicotinate-nucleotide diphosphorylase [Kineosporia sp. A_224]|uniref:carboxylating nicotinate-nucleotide diphosphorylase n=1 Tax=Kineosporia sp. A_224 TaxID=1962180 RepID=UPI0018E98402|nr:carboxylating nicotinate-nucleotide diphosphorylase [Kineosporia sp. A_224]
MSPQTVAQPLAQTLAPQECRRLAALALDEDLAGGTDITTLATVAAQAVATGDLVARRAGVVAGLPVARAVFEQVLAGAGLTPEQARDAVVEHVADGSRVVPGDVLLTVTGPARAVLTGERSALNLVGQLSGVATLTAAWVEAVGGTGAVVRDTRKTVPGMRAAQKYAVRCGGGSNHRMGLADQALVKDNHVLAAGSVTAALAAVRAVHPDVVCEVECDTLDQVVEAVAAGATLVLLDNMDLATTRAAVEIARAAGARTESSGSLSLDRARAVALTGVDFLAVGALTHSAPVLDIGLDLREPAARP